MSWPKRVTDGGSRSGRMYRTPQCPRERRRDINGGMHMNRGVVGWVSRTAGIVAAALMLLAVPRAQEIPVAPYEEVKPWGPGTPGSLEWEPAGVDTDRQGRVYF